MPTIVTTVLVKRWGGNASYSLQRYNMFIMSVTSGNNGPADRLFTFTMSHDLATSCTCTRHTEWYSVPKKWAYPFETCLSSSIPELISIVLWFLCQNARFRTIVCTSNPDFKIMPLGWIHSPVYFNKQYEWKLDIFGQIVVDFEKFSNELGLTYFLLKFKCCKMFNKIGPVAFVLASWYSIPL